MIILIKRIYRRIQQYNMGKYQSKKWLQMRTFGIGFNNINSSNGNIDFKLKQTFEVMYSESSGYRQRSIDKMLQTMRRYNIHDKLKHLYDITDWTEEEDCNPYGSPHYIMKTCYYIIPKYPLYVIAQYIDKHWLELCM
jgi:hypothetical protein